MQYIIVLAICSMALCFTSSADVIHVPEEYETIQEAIDAAGLGDIIAVAFGTYEENIELKPGITVLGSNPKPTIDGSGDMYGSTVEYSGYGPSPHQTTLQNFIITGASRQVRLNYVGNVEILGNTLIQNVTYSTGVDIAYSEPDIVISSNEFSGGAYGVRVEFSSQNEVSVEQNTISGASSSGLYVDESWVAASGNTITSCNTGAYYYDANGEFGPDNSVSNNNNCGFVYFSEEWNGWAVSVHDNDFIQNNCGLSAFAMWPDGGGGCSGDNNTFTGNTSVGISVGADPGLFCSFGGSNTTISGSETAIVVQGGHLSIQGNFLVPQIWDCSSGIELHSGSTGTIESYRIEDIDGSAITVETANSAVNITGCHIYGDADEHEGIAVVGDGTNPTVRGCYILEYSGPTPGSGKWHGKGVKAIEKANPDLGTLASPGENWFDENQKDLWYDAGREANPDSLYAIMNSWSYEPPTLGFGGRHKDFIVYEPYLTFRGGACTAAPLTSLAQELKVESSWHGQVEGEVGIMLSLTRGGYADVGIWDLGGRKIRTLCARVLDPGEYTLVWHGVTDTGSQAPAGAYIVRAEAGDRSCSSKTVLFR